MAKFEGIVWADKQIRFSLADKTTELLEADAKIASCSRSTNYAIFLAFEGIRFFCRTGAGGRPELLFLNWRKNLERFRRGMAFNIGADQERLVPSVEDLETLFIRRYFAAPEMSPFLKEMMALGAQGYLRPFTVDEEQSIGVTFPNQPAIRALACRYDRYMGEPFGGVVVPHLVRAVTANGTGCLKLGVNYLISVKAIEAARKIWSEAASALFLDDRPDRPIEERFVTEWDSYCCLFALKDGTVIKIPENPLILPSITIQGMVLILRHLGVPVEERPVSYGELLGRVRAGELAAICSVGTAGILNRCAKLLLTDGKGGIAATHTPDEKHPLYAKLAEARAYYWDIYREKVPPLAGMDLYRYQL